MDNIIQRICIVLVFAGLLLISVINPKKAIEIAMGISKRTELEIGNAN